MKHQVYIKQGGGICFDDIPSVKNTPPQYKALFLRRYKNI